MVTTAADENLNRARDNVREAIQALTEIVINECWGHDDFREGVTADMYNALQLLIDVRKQLNWN